VSKGDLTTLVSGNSAFALELYQAFREREGNLFYSPYSISLALAMTYAGARGETAQQMADTLHFALSQERLHPVFNSLDLELSQRGQSAKGKRGREFKLNIVNDIWGQKDHEFLPEFLDTLAENYGAGLRVVDFKGAPEEACITINEWVSDQTEGRIKDLVPLELILAPPRPRLVLTNAIYFDVAWQYAFNKDRTKDGLFYLLDGNAVTVPMMRQTRTFGYAEGDGYQAVELLYDGGELSMVILLPQAGQFEILEGSLDAQQASAILGKLERQEVRLTMPRFEFESSFRLGEALAAMGMPDAFKLMIADFSGITTKEPLFIREVVHKAFISVDEAGTEAAAGTAVIVPPSAPPPGLVEVTVDHPFIFLIRDIETGTILFIGRVVNPSA
jgi:serpin B